MAAGTQKLVRNSRLTWMLTQASTVQGSPCQLQREGCRPRQQQCRSCHGSRAAWHSHWTAATTCAWRRSVAMKTLGRWGRGHTALQAEGGRHITPRQAGALGRQAAEAHVGHGAAVGHVLRGRRPALAMASTALTSLGLSQLPLTVAFCAARWLHVVHWLCSTFLHVFHWCLPK